MNNYIAVVGIDFGTYCSGYAYAYTARPSTIVINSPWPFTKTESKTLTAILLDKKDLTTIAFGSEAREAFILNSSAIFNDTVLYFERFKMILHQRGEPRNTVKAVNCDYEIPIVKLMGLCIAQIKKAALDELNMVTKTMIDSDQIKWVLTVPAIWDQAARALMAAAAMEAGISRKTLLIALEPEVATLNCIKPDSNISINSGESFMVVDAGGGTVDIIVHRKEKRLVELVKPSGGGWGSVNVNDEFEQYLGEQGIDVRRGTVEWCSVMDSFEMAKKNFRETGNRLFLTTAINVGALSTLAGGFLRIDVNQFAKLFEPTIAAITNEIGRLMDMDACSSLSYLFLVGGYAESHLLQSRIQKQFQDANPKMKIIIPNRPMHSVLIGAVMYGLSPEFMESRVAPLTIGIEFYPPWNEEVHAGRIKVVSEDGQFFCEKEVDVFVQVGDNIPTDMELVKVYEPFKLASKETEIIVVASNKRNVTRIDADVKFMASIKVSKLHGAVEVRMRFGGTTFEVEAKSVNKKKEVNPVTLEYNYK